LFDFDVGVTSFEQSTSAAREATMSSVAATILRGRIEVGAVSKRASCALRGTGISDRAAHVIARRRRV
jgi:hypothetical protein